MRARIPGGLRPRARYARQPHITVDGVHTMGKASAERIKQGIQVLVGKPDFQSKYKNVDNVGKFDSLCSALEVWLDDKDYGDLTGAKQLVAQVISQYFAVNFTFGAANKIGPYPRRDLAPLVVAAAVVPVYADLNASWAANSSDYGKVRRDVVRVLEIRDAGHTYHQGNFSGTQTLRQIILNVVGMVRGEEEVVRVRGLARTHYNLTLD
jgi:hypothetical protein